MSSPQVEDGFTSIAHELLEAIAIYPFTKMQYQILMVIFRKTYGYGKQVDDIALSHYEKHTRLKKPHVSSTLKSLEDAKAITKLPGVFGFNVSINKHYKQWAEWNSDWDFVADSTRKKNVNTKPNENPAESPEPELTHAQIACWEWAKTQDYWQEKVPTQADFLKLYLRHNSGVKTQYEDFKSKSAQRMKNYGKKKPEDFEFQDFDDVLETGNSDFIEGECEVVE